MKENILSISLGELLKELSLITGINQEEINIELNFFPNFIYGIHKKRDILQKNVKQKMILKIECGSISFNYLMTCDLNELQADGRTLYDHAQIIRKYLLKGHNVDWDKTYIIIPQESVKHIICNIDINQIENINNDDEQIITAITNNKKNKTKQKTLKIN